MGEGTGRERALLGKIGAVCCACTPSSAGVTAVDFCDLGDLLTFVYCSVRRKNKGASAAATSSSCAASSSCDDIDGNSGDADDDDDGDEGEAVIFICNIIVK